MTRLPHVLFFSRGKGRGHAVPDAAIATELMAQVPLVKTTFASYGTGAATLTALGHDTIDLELPEDNPIWDTLVKAARLVADIRPTLVVSHEECAVLPAAKMLGLPTVYLTDWFLGAESVYTQALRFADEVIFLDEAGYQDVPRYLAGKVIYVGPVLGNGDAAGLGKAQCRALLGVPEDATLIVVVPGGAMAHSEALAPILDVVLSAYDALDDRPKRLIWVAGRADHHDVVQRVAGRSDVTVMKPHDTIARTMLAASLVVTKANRVTTLECEALGVPSISISFGHNPPDDNRVARLRTNIALRARGLDADVLHARMVQAMTLAGDAMGVPSDVLAGRRRAVAARLQQHLLRAAPPGAPDGPKEHHGQVASVR